MFRSEEKKLTVSTKTFLNECEKRALMVFPVSMEEFIGHEIVDQCTGGEEQTHTLRGTDTLNLIVLVK